VAGFAPPVAGELYDQTGRQSDALREYRRAAETWPDPRTLTELADICRRERRFTEESTRGELP
jgi:hypothetical protein